MKNKEKQQIINTTIGKNINLLECIELNIKKIHEIEEEYIFTENWFDFQFFFIFNRNEAKTGIISPQKYNKKTEGKIIYISAGTKNNGCHAYVDKSIYINKINSKCLTMGTRGEYNGNMFYQENDFVNSNTCMTLKYNNFKEINEENIKNISLFIASVWNKNRRYGSYGIYPTLKSLENDVIKLPSIKDEYGKIQPDWTYINKYIENLF